MDCSNSKRCAGAVASLPDEPLVEILSRVPVKSLCRFKCVSRAWLNLIADPLHRKKLPQTLEGFLFDSCGDDSDNDDVGDGEDTCIDAVHDCDSDEESGSDGGDGDNLPRRIYGYFVDVSGRSVRPVGPCFPFLTELRVPGIENIRLLHHCNGLLLFGYIQESEKSLSYIVSNPATEQWFSVPSCGGKRSSLTDWMLTSLIFDPAASSAFHLVQIEDEAMIPVHVYSSKSRVWNHVGCDWVDLYLAPGLRSAYVNGMLYVVLCGGMDQIVVMDVEGKTSKIITVPLRVGDEFWPCSDYVGQSQGHLHYIYHADPDHDEIPPEKQSYELFIWVLEDYDTQKWVLKHTVSFLELFGKRSCRMFTDYSVVAIHPDHNLVYLVQHSNRKLISYNMDSKEVCHLSTLGHGNRCITPYVPYYSELSALENKL